MEAPGFWDDTERSQKYMVELKSLKDDKETYEQLESQYEDIATLIEMGYEENDASVIPEIEEMLQEFISTYDNIRMKTLLSGEYDACGAILTLHARGRRHQKSCDWAAMLYRMYCPLGRCARATAWRCWTIWTATRPGSSLSPVQVNGENAFGYLKSEKGVHRLVRISPFNAAGKRQTSFVSCDVMPDIEEDLDVEINPDDLRIDTYRSSGAGGQHINKTSSASPYHPSSYRHRRTVPE